MGSGGVATGLRPGVRGLPEAPAMVEGEAALLSGPTGGWHIGGQRGGRLREHERRRPPRSPPRPAACLSPGQAEPTRAAGPPPALPAQQTPPPGPLLAGSSAASGYPGPRSSFHSLPDSASSELASLWGCLGSAL